MNLIQYFDFTYDKAGDIKRSEGFYNGHLIHNYSYYYDALGRLNSATQYCLDNPFWAKDTLTMSYDDLWRVTSKSQHVSSDGIMSPQPLYAGYDMSYTYGAEPGTHYQLRNVAETSYRTEATPTAADRILNTHSYSYDPNGNLAYMATGRTRSDDSPTPKILERKLLWDAQNRLRALSDDGYVSLYWYDADGNRTVKEHHGGEAVWVNSEPGGMVSGAPRWTVTPGGFITFDGTESYTEHVYIGSERVASIRRPFSTEYYADNVQHLAGVGLGSGVDYSVLISKMRTSAVGACDSLGVPWSSYTSGGNIRSGEATIRHIRMAPTSQDDDTIRPRTPQPDYSQDSVYYYHRDHLGGTMTVTDGAGAPIQQVEYTPWGEVFVELHNDNSGFTTPYLFNGKELDEETGLYYYGARYYDPKVSVWYSVDRYADKYPHLSAYCYTNNSPLNFVDLNGDTTKVVSSNNTFLFLLDDGSNKMNTFTAKQLYDKGIQWFAPSADNYMKLLFMNKYISVLDGIKHFTWNQIVDFSEVDRSMLSYLNGGSGDWKAEGKPGDGYLLSTVNGYPYWTDAIGQIPFALNSYRNALKYYGSHKYASIETLHTGQKFGSGSIWEGIFGKTDNSNNYDNEMIKRAINWAQHRYRIIGIDKWNRNSIIHKTNYSPSLLSKPWR